MAHVMLLDAGFAQLRMNGAGICDMSICVRALRPRLGWPVLLHNPPAPTATRLPCLPPPLHVCCHRRVDKCIAMCAAAAAAAAAAAIAAVAPAARPGEHW